MKRLALDLGGRLVAGRAIDAGPLANARALEAMTAVILSVNKRYRGHAGLASPACRRAPTGRGLPRSGRATISPRWWPRRPTSATTTSW